MINWNKYLIIFAPIFLLGMASASISMSRNENEDTVKKQITPEEAMHLIRRARVLNTDHSFLRFGSPLKGNKQLKKLLIRNRSQFSDESIAMIEAYLKTGRIPSSPR